MRTLSGSLSCAHLGLSRHRWIAAGVGCALVAALGVQTVAAGAPDEDDLKDRRSAVKGDLRDARGDLGHSSKELVRAVRRLEDAETNLSEAEAHLRRTRDLLASARAFDRAMQRKLDDAKERLAQARVDLELGRQEVARQRDRLAEFAAESFQSPANRLLELRVLLKTETPQSLTTQMDAVDSVASKQSATYARLRASEVLLKVNEDEVEAAKKQVAKQRAAAARNLERKRELEAEAQATEQEVSELVAVRATARREAREAKQADLAQVEELEQERERVQEQLAELARQRRAEIARQKAAAARAARQRALASQSTGGGGGGGSAGGSAGLSYPVHSYITSPYGMRYHPILHYMKLHDGTDFGASCGTPVRAAANGRTLSTYYNSGYGNRVILDHGVRRGVSLSTSYNHLTSYSTYPGQHVVRGEIIGYAGTTGYSTGCHLHFMVYENGATVNPMGWL
ncbi:MAG: peptidoglycan DD-metalloendopeptidase family protein [Nocardioidaceae bacterium]